MASQVPWALQQSTYKPPNTKKHQNVLALETKQKERKGMQITRVPFLCSISFPVYVKARLFVVKMRTLISLI